MARPRKPQYEYVEKLGVYRKRIKDSDGKYVAITASTPEKLTEKLYYAQEQIKQSTFRRENPTVKEYAEKWLSLYAAHIKVSTLADYSSCVKIYIIGVLGDMYMAEVTPDDAERVLTLAATKSRSIYKKARMLIRNIFDSAVNNNIIDKSPCEDLNPRGGKPAKEKEALDDEQCKILLDTVAKLPVNSFVMLGLYAGLRREEALALRWEYVFLDAKSPYISIRKAWHTEHNRPVILDELKSKAARRNIPIPPQLAACLKAEKERSKSEYVIANSDGDPLSETQWQRLWKYVVTRTTKERTYTRYVDGKKEVHTVKPVLGQKAAHNGNVVYTMDFVPTPHQLRHTYITNLLLKGTDIKTTQYLAGHEHASITLEIYAHLFYNRPEDFADKVNKAFAISSEVSK